MPFEPASLLESHKTPYHSLNQQNQWMPILQHACDFNPAIFDQVSVNLIKNPNINSTHLFRADILYDSYGEFGNGNHDQSIDEVRALLEEYSSPHGIFPGFKLQRTMIRRMIPRNPQLDRPIAQTCELLQCMEEDGVAKALVVYIPHVKSLEELPWYHPSVKAMAYLHIWKPEDLLPASEADADLDAGSIESLRQGMVSLHINLFPSQSFPLPDRLLRTTHHLLAIVYKHGQGLLGGYSKKVHHDQVISQQNLQDTYTELKALFGKRLCDQWVEQTESSKHVFEDIGIAAFLIELWKDMYSAPKLDEGGCPNSASRIALRYDDQLPPFPGFVDIGCGNGVLVEILLQSGYSGWGFDARSRKTWAILSPDTRTNLHQMILVPKPLFDVPINVAPRPKDLFHRALHTIRPTTPSKILQPPKEPWHDGVFPKGIFIISNHADELTPWTPLLASLSQSPFLAIPCCSHNLSGLRFRAPSVFNSLTADLHAPAFFAANKGRAKSVPISLASNLSDEDEIPASPRATIHYASSMPSVHIKAANDVGFERLLRDTSPTSPTSPTELSTPSPRRHDLRAETGSLKSLAPSVRAKLPSAYSSLCDWVEYLASEVGYVVEREALRIPSTRNIGIVGRAWRSGYEPQRNAGDSIINGPLSPETGAKSERRGRMPFSLSLPEPWGLTQTERNRLVRVVLDKQGADGKSWIERCRGLAKGRGNGKKSGHD